MTFLGRNTFLVCLAQTTDCGLAASFVHNVPFDLSRKNTFLVCLAQTTACGLAASFAPTDQGRRTPSPFVQCYVHIKYRILETGLFCGSAFLFADPDPAVHLNADPDPSSFLNADPDPA